jgi:hypothetical protein
MKETVTGNGETRPAIQPPVRQNYEDYGLRSAQAKAEDGV